MKPKSPAPLQSVDSPKRRSEAAEAPPALRTRYRKALTVALIVAFLGAAWIVAPLYAGVLLGAVMAFTAYPLFGWLVVRRRWQAGPAAAVTTAVGATLILAGGGAFVVLLIREFLSLVRTGEIARLEAVLAPRLLGILPGSKAATLSDSAHEQLSRLSTTIAQGAEMALSATTSAVMATVIALFTMYYVTREWPRLSVRLERLLPLDPAHTRALIVEIRVVARTAFVGSIAAGVVQGALAGVGFVMMGVHGAITLAGLSAVASFVPVFGPSLVWVPVAAYLVLSGHLAAAIFTVAWGLGVVMAATDYVIRPRLVGGIHNGHPLLVLLGVLGGIQLLGLMGLIVGPVLLSLFVAILRIYEGDRAG